MDFLRLAGRLACWWRTMIPSENRTQRSKRVIRPGTFNKLSITVTLHPEKRNQVFIDSLKKKSSQSRRANRTAREYRAN